MKWEDFDDERCRDALTRMAEASRDAAKRTRAADGGSQADLTDAVSPLSRAIAVHGREAAQSVAASADVSRSRAAGLHATARSLDELAAGINAFIAAIAKSNEKRCDPGEAS